MVLPVKDTLNSYSKYNLGVGLSAASGSVITVSLSVITLLLNKLADLSSSSPVVVISLSVVIGLAVLALISGLFLIVLYKGSREELNKHLDETHDVILKTCAIDEKGNLCKKSDGKLEPLSEDPNAHTRVVCNIKAAPVVTTDNAAAASVAK